jgi:hypothetical protein
MRFFVIFIGTSHAASADHFIDSASSRSRAACASMSTRGTSRFVPANPLAPLELHDMAIVDDNLHRTESNGFHGLKNGLHQAGLRLRNHQRRVFVY